MGVKIKNRSGSTVIYNITEDRLRREFSPGEVKDIPEDELNKLTYQPGGRKLIEDYLLIENEAVTSDIGIKTEPEYWMTESEVIDLLKNGSLDAFLDCLDFAPAGVLDMIKYYSVTLPLNDVNKREAIKSKLNFDVGLAIKNNEEDKKDAPQTQERRVKPTEGRRTSPTNYKVVTPKK